MTMATFTKERVHSSHDGKHGVQADMVLDEELRVLHPDRQAAESELR